MPIELDLLSARQTARPEHQKWADANGCEHHTEDASGERQHCALGQTLAHQAAPSRPESHAHRKFTLARDRACQEQTGYIHTRNQQHQADGAQQQP